MVVRDRDPVVSGLGGFQNDVTADLVHLRVLPFSAQRSARQHTRNVTGNLHATSRTSSRTRWSRTRSGRGRSKKNAEVASSTLLRNSSQVSPSVKMLSVRHSAQ